jgi:transcriptional regulator with XRE-family HTH domain
MTQRHLAERTGIPQSSIARIERGVTVPRVDTLQRLLRATGNEIEVEARLGEGVDRSVMRGLLRLTPDERGRAAMQAGQSFASFRAEARIRGRSRTT